MVINTLSTDCIMQANEKRNVTVSQVPRTKKKRKHIFNALFVTEVLGYPNYQKDKMCPRYTRRHSPSYSIVVLESS